MRAQSIELKRLIHSRAFRILLFYIRSNYVKNDETEKKKLKMIVVKRRIVFSLFGVNDFDESAL